MAEKLDPRFLSVESLLGEMKEFKPLMWYNDNLDWLIFQTEDCSYVSEYVNDTFKILHHMYENRVIGIKVKGVRSLQQSNCKFTSEKD